MAYKLDLKNKINPSHIKVWVVTLILSLIYLFAGFKLVSKDLDVFKMEGAYAVKARVTEIGEYEKSEYVAGLDNTYENGTLYFHAEVLSGKEFKGQTVYAAQTFDNYSNMSLDDPVVVGDKVMLYNYGTPQGDADWVFGGFERLDAVIWLGVSFGVLLIVFGRIKGLNIIVSLALTCLSVFMVFVPSVLAGYNIYFMTMLTCIFSIVTTLLITNGATQKSFTTILGCSFGVMVAALLSICFDKGLRLTGLLDEHSIYLRTLGTGVEVNLRALVFAMIVIGAMGADMDVAMDISSSLNELHTNAPHMKFRDLFRSGITIGQDIMGTMANTLVLAYIGSSLCSILIYITYSSSLYELLNRENIIVDLLNALIGSMAILLTIPLTTLVCCALYTGRGEELLERMSRSKGTAPAARTAKAAPAKAPVKAPVSAPAEPARTPNRAIEFTRPMQSISSNKTSDDRYQYKSLIPDKDPINFYADFEKRPEQKKNEEENGQD